MATKGQLKSLAGNFKSLLEGFEAFEEFEKAHRCVKCGTKPESKEYYLNSKCDHGFCFDCKETLQVPARCDFCDTPISLPLFRDPAFPILCDLYSNAEIRKKIENERVARMKKSFNIRDFELKNKFGESEIQALVTYIMDEPTKYSVEDLKKAIGNKANPNTYDSILWTPMHKAIDGNSPEILELLLAAGGDPDSYYQDKMTCLHLLLKDCVEEGLDETKVRLLTLLLEYNANLDLKDEFGVTPREIVQNHPEIKAIVDSVRWKYNVKRIPMQFPTKRPLFYFLTSKSYSYSRELKLKVSFAYDQSVTHIVTNGPIVGDVVVLSGILSGCFFLNETWVNKSIAKKAIQPIYEYECKGTVDYPDSDCFHKARMNYLKMKPRLFAGGHFHLDACIKPADRALMTELIAVGGGKVLMRDPKCLEEFDKETVFIHGEGSFSKCSLVFLYSSDKKPFIVYETERVKSLPVKWFFEAIQTFSIKEPTFLEDK